MTGYEGTTQVFDATHTHAVDKIGTTDRYDYDAAGNMITRNKGLASAQTLTWNSENRLAGISGGGLPTESYLYDPDGNRVKKVSSGVATYYVSPAYEVTGSTVTKYIYLNGQRIAMERGSTVTYLHTDHLGSTVAESSGTTVTTSQSYCAYGRKRTTSGGNTNCSSSNSLVTDHTFTGQKYDSSGLQFFNARYYDPQIGAFISPDTIVPDPSLVIDYNRYVYARGNALRFSDPSGHYSDDEIVQHFGCGNWECVEGHFQDGGSHAGLWGWLYILQQAEDGYAVSSYGMTFGQGHGISGTFQKNANGTIEISMRSGHLPAMSEDAFAQYAVAWNWGAKYTLRDLGSSPSGYWLNDSPFGGVMKADTFADTLHNYTTFDSSKVDKSDLAIALLKSGELAGPAVAKLPHSAAKGLGTGLTVIGEATSLVVDLAPAFVALSHWDPWPLIDHWRGDVIDTATGVPGVSSAADLQSVLAPGFCHGTHCRER